MQHTSEFIETMIELISLIFEKERQGFQQIEIPALLNLLFQTKGLVFNSSLRREDLYLAANILAYFL